MGLFLSWSRVWDLTADFVAGMILQTAISFLYFGTLNLVCWIYGEVIGLFGIKAVGIRPLRGLRIS